MEIKHLEGIRACVFDAYGTLFDVHGPVSKLAAEIGPKADELSKLWRQKQLEYSWLRSLMGVHADFWKVTGDALDYALGVCGIQDPGLKDELMVFYLKLDAYADAAEALVRVDIEHARGLAVGVEAQIVRVHGRTSCYIHGTRVGWFHS